MVIKVDFDLTISILTHNIYRLFATDLQWYSNLSDQSIYELFIDNSADIKIGKNQIDLLYKTKRNLPLMLDKMSRFSDTSIPWLNNLLLSAAGDFYS